MRLRVKVMLKVMNEDKDGCNEKLVYTVGCLKKENVKIQSDIRSK